MAFFRMHDEYKNEISIGKDKFLKNARANLLQREYDLLVAHLQDYQIEYVLTCKDGNQIVMVNAKMNTDSTDAFTDVSNALLSCMPQEMIMVLHGIHYGKIYTATRSLQKNNPGKANIEKKETSYTFHVSDAEAALGRYLRDIEITPIKKKTSYEVIKSWGELIHIANKKHRKLMTERNRYWYSSSFFSLKSDDPIVEHDDPESYFELKQELVEDACNLVGYIWGVYLDETELETVDVEAWLSAYIRTIDDFVRDYAYTFLTEADVKSILDSFDEQYQVYDDAFTGYSHLDPGDILLHMYALCSNLWDAEGYSFERESDKSFYDEDTDENMEFYEED